MLRSPAARRSKAATSPGIVIISVGLQPLHVQLTGKGKHVSVCVPAASIRYLRGAELAVMQVSSNQQICAQFEFQNNLPLQVRPDGGRVSAKGPELPWVWFRFSYLVASLPFFFSSLCTDWLVRRVGITIKILGLRSGVIPILFYACMYPSTSCST